MKKTFATGAVAVLVFRVGAACQVEGQRHAFFDESKQDAEVEQNVDPTTPSSGFGDTDASLPDSGGSDAKPEAPNLVPNGDFELGALLFGSDYTYGSDLWPEGTFYVGPDGQAVHPNFINAGDHTSGSGLMFIGNGKSTPDRVWFTESEIFVTPNTQYYFEAWVMNLCCRIEVSNNPDPVGPAELSFYANDELLGTRTSTKLGVWEGLSTVWNSGSATSVTLRLVNSNTVGDGNDFAVDDIYLGTETSMPGPK